jgi:hypothetical protein
MKKFDLVYSQLLKEFNVEDRNDPSFYDYVVIMLQQIKQKNLLDPNKLSDIRKAAMDIVRKGYFNFIDEKTGVSQKVDFIFKGGANIAKSPQNQTTNNLTVRVTSVPPKRDEKPKVIDNTYDEDSISEIVDYLETKQTEAKNQQTTGTEVPAQVGETPSQLPGAEQPADTSQYLKGL